MSTSPYLPPSPAPPDARLRLICVPFAGGGAGVYRTWPEVMAPDVHVVPLQLPGRERRLREPAIPDMNRLVDDLVGAVSPLLDLPYALFGHSMGGAVAWELALRLAAAGRPPVHLFVSARRAPDLPLPHPPLFALPEDRLIAEMERFYGPLPAMLKQHPSMLATFLPTMRADLQLLDTWIPPVGETLSCPITALGGEDDVAVAPDTLIGWGRCTSSRFARFILPGGHFFVRDADQARDTVAAALRRALASA